MVSALDATVLKRAAALALCVMFLAGCSPAPTKSLGLDPANVASVELFIYPYGADDPEVKHTVLTNPELISEHVGAYTDTPGQLIASVPEEALGKEATDVRYNLTDGSSISLTRISLAPEDTVVLWPDGDIQLATWGVENADYYDDLGETTTVDASMLPSRQVP